MNKRLTSKPGLRGLVVIAVGSLTGLIAPMPSPAQPSRPEELESGFRRQLLPWADQSEAVLNRLRQVQAEMLRASLRRCQQRGLLTPDQALGVEQRLKLPPAEAPP